jgi:hypothetical protein
MGVLSWTNTITGLGGVVPGQVIIDTNDTLATVTTAGYLTPLIPLGLSVGKKTQALVGTTTGSYWMQVAITGTGPNYVYSLINDLSGGNVIAGSNGVAGYLATYPSASSTGYLKIQGVANSGNYIVTLSNASFGQASTVTFADPANAAGKLLIAAGATPFVSGNIPVASGTAGLMVDSGVSSTSTTANALQTFTATVTLTASQVNGAYAAPAALIPAPGAGLTILPLSMAVYTNVSTAFAAGANAAVQYGATVHGGGTNAFSAVIPTAEITAASSQIYWLGPHAGAALTGITNAGLYFSNITQAFTTGTNSTVTFVIQYCVITATV